MNDNSRDFSFTAEVEKNQVKEMMLCTMQLKLQIGAKQRRRIEVIVGQSRTKLGEIS